MFFYSEPVSNENQIPVPVPETIPSGSISIEEGMLLVTEENGAYIVLE